MTDSEVQAIVRGIVPVLKQHFDGFSSSALAQISKRDETIATLEQRIADLEDEATRP